MGVWVENEIDLAACVIAAATVRAEAFLLPPAASVARVAELCALEGAAAVACDDARAVRLTQTVAGTHSSLGGVGPVGGTGRVVGPGLTLVEWRPQSMEGGYDGGSVHFFTSGTDGQPKGLVRTNESLRLEEATVGAHLGMAPGCVVLCAVPVIHGYGFTAGLFAPLSLGGTAVIARPRLAASLEKLLITHQPDIVVAVPAQYAAWSALRSPHIGPVPRVWLCGGAPLPAAVRARFEAAWGGVIAEQYGMTEVGAVSVDLDGSGSLGRPYPGVTLAIDSGAGEIVGEVVVDAPYAPIRYVGVPGRPLSADTGEGFRTGDFGWLDEQGRLRLVGRRTHQLNVRGQKVDPAEVERAFWALNGVREVAVIGVDRAEGDQWIAAFVACSDSIDDDALHGATAHLESFKRPQRVTRLSALPNNAVGKTDFEALRRAVQASLLS